MRTHALLLLLCSALAGCTRYEYDLAEPPELARRVGIEKEVSFPLDAVEYRLITADNHLVMSILNNTPAPIELVDRESYVVDPKGLTRPIHGQIIAPNSYVKIYFPPLRPMYYLYPYRGATFDFGIGVHSDAGDNVPAAAARPIYLSVEAEEEQASWDWPGEWTIRIRLVFKAKDRSFTHAFAFHRVKVKQ